MAGSRRNRDDDGDGDGGDCGGSRWLRARARRSTSFGGARTGGSHCRGGLPVSRAHDNSLRTSRAEK